MHESPSGGIAVRALVKRFKNTTALTGVDAVVPVGGIACIVGPNGAGKSTLLRILSGTVLPDSGTASVAGHDVATDAAAARRSLGFVMGDGRSWHWRLSGRRNLEFFASLYGTSRRRARGRCDELLEEVGLGAAADRRVGEYSTGMRARLSLARALLHDPPVLILDEPSATLDPVGAREFRARLVGLARERRTTVLVATHDLHEAAEIADEVLILREGRVAAVLAGGSTSRELEDALMRTLQHR